MEADNAISILNTKVAFFAGAAFGFSSLPKDIKAPLMAAMHNHHVAILAVLLICFAPMQELGCFHDFRKAWHTNKWIASIWAAKFLLVWAITFFIIVWVW